MTHYRGKGLQQWVGDSNIVGEYLEILFNE